MKFTEKLCLVLLIILTVVIFGSITWQEINFSHSDYATHNALAQELAETATTNESSHILYQQMVVAVRAILPFTLFKVIMGAGWDWFISNSYQISALLVCLIFYIWLAVLLYKKNHHKNLFLRTGTSLALMLVTPITLFTISQHRLYLGYIGINIYHSPNMVLLKPLSLLLFWTVIDQISKKTTKSYLIITILLVLSNMMAKPSFMIIFLPGLVIWFIIQLILKQKINWTYVLLAVFLPAVIVLGIQFVSTFGSTSSSINFAPLTAMLHYAPSRKALLFWLLMSLAFPVVVFFTYIKRSIKDSRLVLSSIILFLGLALTYLFIETGHSQFDLNFEWSAEIALFIAFVECTFFTLREIDSESTIASSKLWRQIPLLLFFCLHLVSGVIFYILEFTQPQLWWGWS